MRVEYSSNNSGGDWWLTDEHWKALEQAGWKVDWIADQASDSLFGGSKDGRWLGALAREATRHGLSLSEAIQEWERVTGLDSDAEGCPCCGEPHYFSEYEDSESDESAGSAA